MRTLTIQLMLCSASLLSAQDFDWAVRIGGPESESVGAVSVDDAGNIYTAGSFRGTVDFDPGPDILELTSAGYQDIFISKVSPAGVLQWAKQIGSTSSDVANAIDVDANGNILATGYYRDAVDFDPGPDEYLLTTPLWYTYSGVQYWYGSDLFILKLDPSGNFIWAGGIGGNLEDFGTAIAADENGDVFISGEFSTHLNTDSCDFDPGAGVHLKGGGGAFILALTASGTFDWVKTFGQLSGASSVCGGGGCSYNEDYSVRFNSMVLDASGNLVLAGGLGSIFSEDLDPGPGTFTLKAKGSLDVLILKLTHDGDFIWAKQMGGTNATATLSDVDVDATGNVHSVGYFIGQVDFNPGSGTANLTSAKPTGNTDVFVSKLTAAGDYSWAKSFGEKSDDIGYDISLDSENNVYTTGWFGSKVDFDPGSAKYFLTASATDAFISKLNSSGNFSWATKIGGTGNDSGTGIAIDEGNSIISTGGFSNTVDFDPNTGVYNLTSDGQSDMFILKLSQSSLELFAAPISQTINSNMDIVAYPNPSLGEINVVIPEHFVLANTSLRLYAQDGQLQHAQSKISEHLITLDLSDLPTGVYYLYATDGTQSGSNKILKKEGY